MLDELNQQNENPLNHHDLRKGKNVPNYGDQEAMNILDWMNQVHTTKSS